MLASKFDADAMRKEGAAPHSDPITNYFTGTRTDLGGCKGCETVVSEP